MTAMYSTWRKVSRRCTRRCTARISMEEGVRWTTRHDARQSSRKSTNLRDEPHMHQPERNPISDGFLGKHRGLVAQSRKPSIRRLPVSRTGIAAVDALTVRADSQPATLWPNVLKELEGKSVRLAIHPQRATAAQYLDLASAGVTPYPRDRPAGTGLARSKTRWTDQLLGPHRGSRTPSCRTCGSKSVRG